MTGSIYDWSLTASNNQTADGDINWQESQLPDTVNNSARVMMKRQAEWLADVAGSLNTAGSSNAYTVTANSAFTSLVNGLRLTVTASFSNTGAATLNANSIGAKALRKQGVSTDVALVSGDIISGQTYHLIYSTAANSSAGAWIVLNPGAPAVLGTNISIVSSSVDNTIPRFDGAAGRLQTSGVIITDGNSVTPPANDGGALGSATVSWSDLFLASGGVIGFNNGNYTLTHSAGLLTASGALTVTGNLTATGGAISGASVSVTGTITGNLFSGSGASLTSLNASNLASGTVQSARVSGAYSGITGVGTLSSLATSGNASFFDTDNVNAVVDVRQDGTAPIQRWLGAGAAEVARITATGMFMNTSGLYYFLGENTGMYHPATNEIGFVTNGVEIVRVDAGGLTLPSSTSVEVGTFSATGSSGGVQTYVSSNGARSDYSTTGINSRTMLAFYNANGNVGSVSISGSATTYATSSDGRTKVNRVPLAQEIDVKSKLMALDVLAFDRLSGATGELIPNSREYGLIAQDAGAVWPMAYVPGSEAGPGDPEFQPAMLDLSKFTPLLIAGQKVAFDELLALSARVTALETTIQ